MINELGKIVREGDDRFLKLWQVQVEEANRILREHRHINFEIAMVLSGMSDEAQMADNLETMGDFKPLTEAEHEAVKKVRTIYQSQHKVPCTACSYCVDGCPAGIPIPDIFALLNKKLAKEDFDEGAYGALENKADSCVGCGACETSCPQKLEIRQLLKQAHKTLG